MNTSRLALTLGMLCVLLAPALLAQDVLITPSAITSSTSGTDVSPAVNLINGNGLSGTPTLAALGTHASSGNINAWVTQGIYPGDYFALFPQPVLTCTLPGGAKSLSGLVIWGFDGNPSEAKFFTVSFSTDGTNFANPAIVTQPTLLGTGAAVLPFPDGPRLATHVKVTVTDNYYIAPGTAGGDRVVLGELRFAGQNIPIVVTTNADSGTGSLRAALVTAAAQAGPDTITFDPGLSGQTITLSSFSNPGGIGNTALVVNDSGGVTLDASALPAGLTISDGTSTNFRLFSVSSGTTFALHSLTLANGGGVNLPGNGGTIDNGGTLTLTRCTLSGNSAGAGGAIRSQNGTLTLLTHCTLSGNSATASFFGLGGAIRIEGGTLTLTHCTLLGNSAPSGDGDGGAIYVGNGGTLNLTHSIVAGNTAKRGLDIYRGSGTIITTGVNFIGDTTNSGLTASTTILTGDAMLAPLGNYGGPTQTMPPQAGSPAIDAATGSTATTDQRGISRPQIGSGPAIADLGAVEVVATLSVTNTNDTGPGSLRQAVADAAILSGAHSITFAPALSGGTLSLGSEIVLGSEITLDASSLPAGLTINDGSGDSYRLFRVSSGTTVTLRGLTLADGGGSAFSGNGGAIYNDGTLTLTHCTLSGNTVVSGSGGAIFNSGTLTLAHCTLSGNSANFGGAIDSGNGNSGDTLTLTHCTLSGNSAGIIGGAISSGGILTLTHSIVAGNSGGGTPDIWRYLGSITATGVNFIGNTATSGLTASTTVLTGDAMLAPLGNYGGPTQTMPPKAGSPAIDAATGSTATTDQRGISRPQIGTGTGPAIADLGAVEVVTTLSVTNTDDTGPGSLRQAVADAATAPGPDAILFAPALSGGTLSLGSEIVLGSEVTLDASSLPAGLTINDGTGDSYRLFSVSSGTTVTLRGLTLADGGGAAFIGDGGAIDNDGTLTLTHCTLSGNSAAFGGGAIYNNGGTLTLTHCTLSGNSAYHSGGAIYNSSGNGTLNLTHSIVAGNTGSASDIHQQGGTITPTGVNLIGNLVGSGLTAGPNVLVGAPQLAPLGNYGGPTQTMPPRTGSPAINAATGSTPTADQRGLPIVGTPDIGAAERQPATVVTSTAYDGVGSLRVAVTLADTVTFAPGLSGRIVLGSEIILGSSVTLDGGSSAITIDGGPGTNRLFTVNSGQTVALIGLTLTGGNGGGSTVGGLGGAVFNNGTLTMERCTLTGNAGNYGGAIFNENGATLTLTRCTLAGNGATPATVEAGALYNRGTATLTHCTVSGNTATNFGGLYNDPNHTLTLANTIVAGNTGAQGPDIFNRPTGMLNRVGANVVGTVITGGGTVTGPGSIITAAPLLAPLGNYGGPTQTMALLPGSPARDAALTSNTVQNSSFEATVIGGVGDYTYTGSITGWTSSSASLTGLSRAGSPFTNNGTIPHGAQVAFLQSTGSPVTTLTTTLTGLTAGQSYTVSFRVNAREAYTTPALSWSVSSGATTLFSTGPTAIPAVGGTNPYGTVSGTFTATATTATLVIGNQTAAGTDSTLLLDAVSVFPTHSTDQRGFPIAGTPDIGAYEAGTATNYAAYIWETLPTAGNGLTTDPLHAPTYDYDGDGQSNEAEWRALTDAASARSTFRVTETALSGNTFTITVPTALGRTYQLQSSPNLANPWTNIGTPTPGTGGNVTLPVDVTGHTSHFFRVSVGP